MASPDQGAGGAVAAEADGSSGESGVAEGLLEAPSEGLAELGAGAVDGRAAGTIELVEAGVGTGTAGRACSAATVSSRISLSVKVRLAAQVSVRSPS